MDQKPKVMVLRTAGTNCDQETAFAFASCGAQVDSLHVNKLIHGQASIHDYHILAIPGGFTYGDDIESGRILANELNVYLKNEINKFIADGKLMIGICNGFQVMVKAGILPGALNQNSHGDFQQTATLTFNDSGKFEARWVHLKVEGRSVWTGGLNNVIFIPVAHGEGKFVAPKETIHTLNENKQIAFRYVAKDGGEPQYPDNPNGSSENIAGITDATGRILGLMPHPERHFLATQHPYWTRLQLNGKFGEGAQVFQNGVDYVKKSLLS